MTPIRINTFKAVKQLESSFTRQQSEALLQSILSTSEPRTATDTMLTRAQADEDAFQYKITLHELRSELASLRKTETASLQAQTFAIQRDLDLMNLKWREDFNTIKSDIQLDLNTRKAELKEEHSKNETRIQEIQHRIMLRAGDLRTSTEAMKLDLLTTWSTGIVLGVTATVIVLLKVVM